jgi:FKBP-type peptidyl-prolyl cis-trans isomerase 2
MIAMAGVKKGDKIKVEYTGKLEDGTVFDSSEKHENPFEFTVGAGEVIQGFDDAVVGMEKGEEKEITIPAEHAYGSYNADLLKDLPRDSFPQDQDISEGMVFIMKLEDGRQVPFRISKISTEQITVDLNPPLAGKTLVFWIKVVDIAS